MTLPAWLRHLFVMLIVAALLVIGLGSSMGRDDFRAALAMEAGARLEIAAAGTDTWSKAIGPTWGMSEMAPGSGMSGVVYLRSTVDDPDGELVMTIDAEDADAELGSSLVIDAMTFGGLDVLPRWSECAGTDSVLTLAEVANCESPPAMPPPPGGAGLSFRMDVRLSPEAGNALQGASYGPLTVAFSLTGEGGGVASPTPSPSETPPPPATSTPDPPDPTPSSTATQTASPTPSATPDSSPTATATTTRTPSATPTTTPAASVTPDPARKDASIAVRIEAEAPINPRDFVVTVEGEHVRHRAAGPTASVRVASGVDYAVSVLGPTVVDIDGRAHAIVIQDVTCASPARDGLEVGQQRLVIVTPTTDEAMECVFRFAVGEATGEPLPPPAPPETGTGAPQDSGTSVLMYSLVVIAGFVAGSFAVILARRAKRQGTP